MNRIAGCLLALLVAAGSLAPAVDLVDEMAPAAAQAVTKGLEAMAAMQGENGAWGWTDTDVALTASCALAFMAHGHVPGSGKYGAHIAKALQFLVRSGQPDGVIAGGTAPMYQHGLATLALAEGWGQTGDPRLRNVLRKAVDLIIATQNAKGGWKYQPNPNNADDISVTVFQLMALRAAKDAGMSVPKEAIDAGIAYVKACHNNKGAGGDGGFAYAAGATQNYGAGADSSGWARTGAGITSLQVAGNYKATEVSEGVEYLLTYQPVGEKANGTNDVSYYYGAYYATMGMYQGQSLGAAGKQAWGRFYPAIVKMIIGLQNPEGLWFKEQSGYTPYASAMSLLILAVPCRYLPIYQR